MRKLMWFAIGFAVAMALGSYVWYTGGYFYIAGACAVVLAIGLALMLCFRSFVWRRWCVLVVFLVFFG